MTDQPNTLHNDRGPRERAPDDRTPVGATSVRNLGSDGSMVRRISWGAIFAGVLTAILVLVLLNLLFFGIGLAVINPASESNPLGGVGIGAIIATIVSNLAALFAGGYVAGRLAGVPRTFAGLMHGVLVWALLTLFAFYLATSAIGSVVSGVTGAVGSAFSTAAAGISSAAGAVPVDAAPTSLDGAAGALNQIPGVGGVQQDIDQLINESGVTNPEQAGRQLVAFTVNRVQAGESLASEASQQQYADIIAQHSDLGDAEIESQVAEFADTAEQRLQEAQDQAVEVAQTAADAAATASIVAFVVLLLGAAIAAAGSALGSPDDEEDAHTV